MAEQLETTNAVKRLRAIATKAAELNPRSQNPNQAITIQDAWAQIFDIPKTGKSPDSRLIAVVEHLLKLRELFSEVIECLQEAELDEELFIAPVKNMSGCASNLNILEQSFETHKHYFNQATMTSLRFIDHEFSLRGQFDEPVIPQADLDQVSREIDELYQQVAASNLKRALKRVILDSLQELRQAIHDYRILGNKAFRDGFGKAVGIAVMNSTELEKAKTTREVVSFGKVMLTMSKIYVLVEKAQPVLEAGITFVKGFLKPHS